jgi:hypothetical protein
VDRRTLGIGAVILVVGGMVAGVLLATLSAGALPGTGSTPTSAPAATTYTSQAFTPPTTVTVPGNWTVTMDQPDAMTLSPLVTDGQSSPVPTDVAGIYLFRDVRAAMQDPACTTKPEAGVASDAKSLAGWVSARPGLTTTEPEPVTIGGLSGYEVEASIKESWTSSCPFANGAPSVSLLANDSGSIRWVVFGTEKVRLAFLDVPGGGTVTVNTSATDGSIYPGLVNEVAPVIASMQFAAR